MTEIIAGVLIVVTLNVTHNSESWLSNRVLDQDIHYSANIFDLFALIIREKTLGNCHIFVPEKDDIVVK